MMNFKKILHLLIAVLSLLYLTAATAAEKPGSSKDGKQSLGKVSGSPSFQILNINNITTWQQSIGESNHSPGGDNGVYYPVGTGNVVYEDGIVFGSKLYLDAARKTPTQSAQKVRVGGGSYLSNVGTKAGYVTGIGPTANSANPNDPDVRMYRIRRDYASMSQSELVYDAQTSNELAGPAAVTQSMVDAIVAQYALDWTSWPVDKGAPYIERNGKPGYQAPPPFSKDFTVDSLIAGNYDEPGVGDPNTPADQVMWTAYNDLDKSKSINFEGSEPTGLEIQVTKFGYKRTDAMGNCYFSRVRILNKGGVDLGTGTKGAFYLDSMYVCQWSDIDLGYASDDLAGCDSARSMAYVYNGASVDKTFAKYGLPPPASGYTFLAGPTVAGAATDSAVVDFKRVFGKKNLPMSGFSYFSAGSPYTDPAFANYPSGTGQWWNMLRGYAPLGTITDPPVYYAHPTWWWDTKFPLSGDPRLGFKTGNFIDGEGTLYSFVLGDRRILLNTGPFQMNPGDVQELYIGYVCGIGGDRLSSVSVMLANNDAVQTTFNLLFKVAKAPQAPVVKVTEMNGEVMLDWGSNPATVAATETKIAEPGHYQFQGYNVYQFPTSGSTLQQGKRIATYDIVDDIKVILNEQFDISAGAFLKVPIQFGSDAGVSRYFRATKDYLRDIGSLYNGQEYYFGVTAYSYTTVSGYVAALESSPNILTVIPKVPFGKVLNGKFGDTLKVTKNGVSDGSVVPLVLNPGALTGDSYKVTFNADGTWNITDVTTGTVKLANQVNQSGDNNYLFVDGMMVKVQGPLPGAKSWEIPSGTRRLSPVGGFIGLGLESFSTASDPLAYDQANGTIGMAGHLAFGGIGTTLKDADYHTVQLRYAAVPATLWDPKATPTDANYSKGYRYLRSATAAAGQPSFVPWIINKASGYPYQDYNYSVPFAAWDMDVTPPVRLAVGNFENNVAAGAVDGRYWPGLTTVDNSVTRELAFIFKAPYTTTPDPALAVNLSNNATTPLMWVITAARRNDPPYSNTDIFQINASHVNSSAVNFTFASPAPTTGADLQAASAKKVGVYPNPYYASNPAETSRFDRYVTFNNLPKNVTIRIFNLAGQLVRTITKSTDSQFQRWDLMNSRNYPVASGVYIAYIEMPDVGVTKSLKFTVIQEQEILDYY
jgi:hypothetical protein